MILFPWSDNWFKLVSASLLSLPFYRVGGVVVGCPPRKRGAQGSSLAFFVESHQLYKTSTPVTSSRSSEENTSLHDEGGSASQVPQATVELAGYWSVVWPDSLSEWLVDGTGLQ